MATLGLPNTTSWCPAGHRYACYKVSLYDGMLAYVPQSQQGDFIHRAPLTKELDKPYVRFLIFYYEIHGHELENKYWMELH